jgi:hypothetical protein
MFLQSSVTVVVNACAQPSQTQWWRISPVSMNSDARAATTYSAQAGQRGMVEKNGLDGEHVVSEHAV